MRSSSPRESPRPSAFVLGIGLLAAGALLLAVGCSKPDEELRIGLIAPLSGPLEAFGKSAERAARLAADEANRGGGLKLKDGRCRVVLVARDGGGSADYSVEATQELIARDKVSAIVGHSIPAAAEPSARLAERTGIPMILRITSIPASTAGARYVSRICFTENALGKALAGFALGTLGARTAALLYNDTELGNPGPAMAFRESFIAGGGRIVSDQPYSIYGRTDFIEQLRRIKAAGPDCLFLPNFTFDVLAQYEQARKLGIKAALVSSDTMSFAAYDMLAALEGVYYAAHFDPQDPSEKVQGFVKAYSKAYGAPPLTGAALAYDAASLLLEAARACGSAQPKAIAEALRAVRTFEGVTGPMRFDGSPDPRKQVVIMKIEGGAPRLQAKVGP